ncbi:MAG: PilZ domain-containing protein [Deltaproteobacteria bacterium]|nr:MAG: PilZ domain-containing protein [Deltaproteobacteria bacterium]
MTKHPERRRATRCPVDFFVQETRGDRTWLHPALDLSVDGIYLLVGDDERAIDSQQRMVLDFTLPSGVPVRVVGHVAYVDDRDGQRGLAITFTDVDDDARLAIARYLDAIEHAQRRVRSIG